MMINVTIYAHLATSFTRRLRIVEAVFIRRAKNSFQLFLLFSKPCPSWFTKQMKSVGSRQIWGYHRNFSDGDTSELGMRKIVWTK